jgi:hypothetical protein
MAVSLRTPSQTTSMRTVVKLLPVIVTFVNDAKPCTEYRCAYVLLKSVGVWGKGIFADVQKHQNEMRPLMRAIL